MTILTTARLRLEPFSSAHLDGLHAMNTDPDVMRFLGGPAESLESTQAAIDRQQARWAQWGHAWWSIISLETGRLVGAGCIQRLLNDAANPLEVGWRLRRDAWGQGYASEAAERMAAFAFEDLQAPLLCAICHPDNTASSAVMERLGMRFRGLERWHDVEAVYEITRDEWAFRRAP